MKSRPSSERTWPAAERATIAAESGLRGFGTQPRVVLIVDDSPAQLARLVELCEAWGMSVRTATTGPAAIHAYLAEPEIQLAIVDWELPELSGTQVISHCKSIDRFSFMLMLTGRQGDLQLSTAFAAGADDFLSKPCREAELKARLMAGARLVETVNQQSQGEAAMHAVLESLNDGLIVTDERGDLLHLNAAAGGLFPEVALGDRLPTWSERLSLFRPDDDRACAFEDLPFVRALNGETVQDAPFRIRQPTVDPGDTTKPTEINVEFSAAPIVDAHGQRIGGVSVIRSIENRLRIQRNLRDVHRLESVGRLAAGLSHEINTPVQYIADNLAFLDTSFRSTLQALAELDEILTTAPTGSVPPQILDESKRVRHLTDLKFLEDEIPRALAQSIEGIARIGEIVAAVNEFSAHSTLERTNVDLNATVKHAATIANAQWRDIANVSTDLDPHLPLVPGDAAELGRVVLQLVANATEALDEANSARATPGHIELRSYVTRDAKRVAIEVIDDGPGIPTDALERIFEPFFTTREMGCGIGQGLAVAHSIVVEKHGGSIEVESEIGTGATFRVLLPLGEPENPRADLEF